MLESDKQKVLELALAALDRQWGKGSVIRLGNKEIEPWPAIKTGILPLDKALGIGGLPLGRIVEIYGAESSSKTTLALSTVANAQKNNLACAYVDIEHSLDPAYMDTIGINLDDLLLAQPNSAEEAFGIVDKLVKTGVMGVIVIDSVAALTPQAEINGEIGDSHMALQARLMSQALRILNGPIADSNCLLIFINQVRSTMSMYGPSSTTAGGKALRFYSSIRIELARKEDLKSPDGGYKGIKVRAKIVKNKLAPALKTIEYDILFGKGIDSIGCIIDMAESMGIIQRKGAWYYYGEMRLAQGRDNTIEYFNNYPDLLEKVKGQID